MKGYLVTFEVSERKFYYDCAVIAKNEGEAIILAKDQLEGKLNLVKVEEFEQGVIMTESYYE